MKNMKPSPIIIDFFGSTIHFSKQLQNAFELSVNSKCKLIARVPRVKKKLHRILEILSITYNYCYLFVLIIKSSPGQLFIFNIPGIPIVELFFLKIIKWRKGVSISILHNEKPSHGESRFLRNYGYSQFYNGSDIVIFHDLSISNIFRTSLNRTNGIFIEFPGYTPFKQIVNSNSNSNILKLGFFGNIRPYKNIESLLKELEMLEVSVLERVSLVISGKTFYDIKKIINGIDDLGLAEFNFNSNHLTDSEFEKLIAECDFLLLPYSDSSGSAVLSLSASLGVPVIVSDIGIFSNFVDKYDNGIKYNHTQAGDFAQVIERLVIDKDLKNTYKNKAILAQLSIPTWGCYVEKISEITNESNTVF